MNIPIIECDLHGGGPLVVVTNGSDCVGAGVSIHHDWVRYPFPFVMHAGCVRQQTAQSSCPEGHSPCREVRFATEPYDAWLAAQEVTA